jgi:hypothetical protein
MLLKNAKFTVYEGRNQCKNYSLLWNRTNNWNTQICSGNVNGGEGFCSGDSGGPLYVLENPGGKYILAGIVSYR